MLPSKLVALQHDVHILNMSVEMAREEAKLAGEAEAEARREMELA